MRYRDLTRYRSSPFQMLQPLQARCHYLRMGQKRLLVSSHLESSRPQVRTQGKMQHSCFPTEALPRWILGERFFLEKAINLER